MPLTMKFTQLFALENWILSCSSLMLYPSRLGTTLYVNTQALLASAQVEASLQVFKKNYQFNIQYFISIFFETKWIGNNIGILANVESFSQSCCF